MSFKKKKRNAIASYKTSRMLRLLGSHFFMCRWRSKTGAYHVGVIPGPRSCCGDDGVLISSSPVHDGLDRAPRVVHVSAVAPVVARLTDGCVVGLRATKHLFMSCNIQHGASSSFSSSRGFCAFLSRVCMVFGNTKYSYSRFFCISHRERNQHMLFCFFKP